MIGSQVRATGTTKQPFLPLGFGSQIIPNRVLRRPWWSHPEGPRPRDSLQGPALCLRAGATVRPWAPPHGSQGLASHPLSRGGHGAGTPVPREAAGAAAGQLVFVEHFLPRSNVL